MNTQKKPFVLIVYGPTGVGKTDFSLEITKQVPAEIINGDIGQFYTPLSIGTAKPDWKNQPVAHHLFDVIDEPRNFSVVEYRTMLLDAVQQTWDRGKLPIIVGGSGFYLKSIFFPPCAGHDERLSDKDFLSGSAQDLWKKLHDVDPVRADQINKGDAYRIKRALIIWKQTGKKPSTCVPTYHPPFDYFLLYLARDREVLFDRINRRTIQMIYDEGWVDEVKNLVGTRWETFLYEKKLIGYDVLLDYLSGKQTEQDRNDAIRLIQQRTRQYAKRQRTFWNRFERKLNEAVADYKEVDHVGAAQLINLTLSNRDLYIKQVLKRLRSPIK